MVGERLAAEDQLILDELLHLLLGVIICGMAWGMVDGWMTRLQLIGAGIVAGILIIAAFVLEQRLRDQLQAADNCSCISFKGDGS